MKGYDVWGILTRMKSLSGEPVCLYLTESYRKPGTSEYIQEVEVDVEYSTIAPEGFDVINLPSTKYRMLQGERFAR